MILAVHQPNYLPWPGFFYKMAQADVFVVLDNVQFPRGASVANRNLIKTPQGAKFLTIPVKRRGADLQTYGEVEVIKGWRDKHLKSLQLNYARAPFYKEVLQKLEEALEDTKLLLPINLGFIRFVYSLLNLQTKVVYLSSLPQIADLKKNELIVSLCRHFSAESYLSGEGAQTYNDPLLFAANKIELKYLNYRPKAYPQLWGDFMPNLSIVDMLFNCGIKHTRDLLLGR